MIRALPSRRRPGLQTTPLRHPHTHLPSRGKRYKILVFKGVTNPKAGRRRRRAQRQFRPITPTQCLIRTWGPNADACCHFCLFLCSRPSWKKWKAGFLLFSSGRRERNKTPRATSQPEDVGFSGKGSPPLVGRGLRFWEGSPEHSATFRMGQASSICPCTGSGWRDGSPQPSQQVCVCVYGLIAQSCPTLRNPMDSSPQGEPSNRSPELPRGSPG